MSGLLRSDGILDGRRLCVYGNSLFGTFHLGLHRLGLGLSGFGIGDSLHGIGLFALLSRGLLELTFGSQRIVPGHSTEKFLRLALDRVDQTLTCLVSFVMFSHLRLLQQIAIEKPKVSFLGVHGQTGFTVSRTV